MKLNKIQLLLFEDAFLFDVKKSCYSRNLIESVEKLM